MKFNGLEKNQFRVKVKVGEQQYIFLTDNVKELKIELEKYDRLLRTWESLK